MVQRWLTALMKAFNIPMMNSTLTRGKDHLCEKKFLRVDVPYSSSAMNKVKYNLCTLPCYILKKNKRKKTRIDLKNTET